MTVHVKRKLISVVVTSGLWDEGLSVALDIDEQPVIQLHSKKNLLFVFKKAALGKPDISLFVSYLLVYFFQSKQNRPEKYFDVNLDSFI